MFANPIEPFQSLADLAPTETFVIGAEFGHGTCEHHPERAIGKFDDLGHPFLLSHRADAQDCFPVNGILQVFKGGEDLM